MKKNDGGPIYPFQELDASGMPRTALYTGMTLRQWYAGMALQGLLSNPNRGYTNIYYVGSAFYFADAMIAHEEKENEKQA